MIFRQIPPIVAGTKTQTRRIVKSNELMCWVDGACAIKTYPTVAARLEGGPGGRIKWRVGQDYAVVPKRGYHGVYYDIDTGTIYGHGYEPLNDAARECRFIPPLRIKILALSSEPLQAITRGDAIAEGVAGLSPIGEYRVLWDTINKAKEDRWEDNPKVWIIKFEVLKQEGDK